MKLYVIAAVIMLSVVIIPGCQKPLTLSIAERQDIQQEKPLQIGNKILIDASRDGGVWWFPQGDGNIFSPSNACSGSITAS